MFDFYILYAYISGNRVKFLLRRAVKTKSLGTKSSICNITRKVTIETNIKVQSQ